MSSESLAELLSNCNDPETNLLAGEAVQRLKDHYQRILVEAQTLYLRALRLRQGNLLWQYLELINELKVVLPILVKILDALDDCDGIDQLSNILFTTLVKAKWLIVLDSQGNCVCTLDNFNIIVCYAVQFRIHCYDCKPTQGDALCIPDNNPEPEPEAEPLPEGEPEAESLPEAEPLPEIEPFPTDEEIFEDNDSNLPRNITQWTDLDSHLSYQSSSTYSEHIESAIHTDSD